MNIITCKEFQKQYFTLEQEKIFNLKLKSLKLKKIDITIFLSATSGNCSCKEIAEVLAISIGSVRYRLSRVRKKFPELRAYNKNIPVDKPTRFSSEQKEISGMKQAHKQLHSHHKDIKDDGENTVTREF